MKQLKQIHLEGPFGDETNLYRIECPKDTTVQQFIKLILQEYPNEWGAIRTKGKIILEYKHGEIDIITADLIKYINCIIKNAKGYGGWSLMDYDIEVE